MSQNLIIVARNPRPKRERHQPDLWLIHTPGERPFEVYRSQPRSSTNDWIPLDAMNRSLT